MTGGVGSLGRVGDHPLDIADDLIELSRSSVGVVCAGAKGVVDLARTVEILESYGVPVVGYGTDSFPAFYVRQTSHPVSARVDSPAEAAKFLATHWALDGAGMLLALSAPAEVALDPELYGNNLVEIEHQAANICHAGLVGLDRRGHRRRRSVRPVLPPCRQEAGGRSDEARRGLLGALNITPYA